MKQLVCSVLFAAIVAGLACKPQNNASPPAAPPSAPAPPKTLTGQIFITLPDRETLKMSLVTVELIEASVAAAHVKEAANQACADLARAFEEFVPHQKGGPALEKEKKALESEIAQLTTKQEERLKQWTDQYIQLIRAGKVPLGDEGKKHTEKEMDAFLAKDEGGFAARELAAHKRLAEVEKARKGVFAAMDKLEKTAIRVNHSDILFQSTWPRSLQKTVTDADGNFSLTLPQGTNCWLVAKAERDAGELKQTYIWALPVPDSPERLLLNNKNVHPSLCPAEAERAFKERDALMDALVEVD